MEKRYRGTPHPDGLKKMSLYGLQIKWLNHTSISSIVFCCRCKKRKKGCFESSLVYLLQKSKMKTTMSELLVQIPPLTKVMSQLVIGCEESRLQASELRPATTTEVGIWRVKVTSHTSRNNIFDWRQYEDNIMKTFSFIFISENYVPDPLKTQAVVELGKSTIAWSWLTIPLGK